MDEDAKDEIEPVEDVEEEEIYNLHELGPEHNRNVGEDEIMDETDKYNNGEENDPGV